MPFCTAHAFIGDFGKRIVAALAGLAAVSKPASIARDAAPASSFFFTFPP